VEGVARGWRYAALRPRGRIRHRSLEIGEDNIAAQQPLHGCELRGRW